MTNDDTAPHTATSGTGPEDPNSAKLFDTSIIMAGETAQIDTNSLEPADYNYHCTGTSLYEGNNYSTIIFFVTSKFKID